MKAAATVTAGFTGALLARYVRQWQRDVRLWRIRIDSLALGASTGGGTAPTAAPAT